MFDAYSYLRQHNNNNEIINYKEFYKNFSNEREFGSGNFSHLDHLIKNRFTDVYGHVSNVILRRQPKNVLDIGCGAGVNLPIANQYPNLNYYGIDYAEKALEHSKSVYKNIDFQVMDAFNLTFDSEFFDVVIVSSVLILYKELSDRLHLLRNASRVLASKNGVLVAIVWNEAPIIKLCIRLSRILARVNKISLPQDFMAVYLKDAECRAMFNEAGFVVKEKILAGAYYGALEATQYLTLSKYRRKFGASEKQTGSIKNQNILEDLKSASGSKFFMIINYIFAKYFPSTLGMYSIYILEKRR